MGTSSVDLPACRAALDLFRAGAGVRETAVRRGLVGLTDDGPSMAGLTVARLNSLGSPYIRYEVAAFLWYVLLTDRVPYSRLIRVWEVAAPACGISRGRLLELLPV